MFRIMDYVTFKALLLLHIVFTHTKTILLYCKQMDSVNNKLYNYMYSLLFFKELAVEI